MGTVLLKNVFLYFCNIGFFLFQINSDKILSICRGKQQNKQKKTKTKIKSFLLTVASIPKSHGGECQRWIYEKPSPGTTGIADQLRLRGGHIFFRGSFSDAWRVSRWQTRSEPGWWNKINFLGIEVLMVCPCGLLLETS